MKAKVKVVTKKKRPRLVLVTSKHQAVKKSAIKKRPRRKLSLRQMHTTIVENHEHGQKLAWKFLKGWRVRLHPDEVKSIVGLALSEAAKRFDPSKNVHFRTFLFYHLRGLLLKEITRLVQDSRIVEHLYGDPKSSNSSLGEEAPEAFIDDIWPLGNIEQKTPEFLMHKREIARMCWDACMCLDELEREVIYRHYVDDQALNIVASELGYCRCHISRVKSRAIIKLQRVVAKSPALREMFLQQRESAAATNGSNTPHAASYSGGRGRRDLAQVVKRATVVAKIING